MFISPKYNHSQPINNQQIKYDLQNHASLFIIFNQNIFTCIFFYFDKFTDKTLKFNSTLRRTPPTPPPKKKKKADSS